MKLCACNFFETQDAKSRRNTIKFLCKLRDFFVPSWFVFYISKNTKAILQQDGFLYKRKIFTSQAATQKLMGQQWWHHFQQYILVCEYQVCPR